MIGNGTGEKSMATKSAIECVLLRVIEPTQREFFEDSMDLYHKCLEIWGNFSGNFLVQGCGKKR